MSRMQIMHFAHIRKMILIYHQSSSVLHNVGCVVVYYAQSARGGRIEFATVITFAPGFHMGMEIIQRTGREGDMEISRHGALFAK